MSEESHASGESGHAESGHTGATGTTASTEHVEKPNILKAEPGLAIWTVATFIALFFVLKKLAWGPILDNLDKREKAIKDALAEAERARAAAAGTAEEQQRVLEEARREAQALLAASRADAERARTDMAARAHEEAEKIIAAGREAVDREKRVALQEIRATTVELALAASGKLLRSKVDDAKSRELVSDYVKELQEN